MNIKKLNISFAVVAALLAAALPHAARAQAATSYSEDFTGATTQNPWTFLDGACLTASTTAATANPGQIPGCTAIFNSYYSQKRGYNPGDTALVGGYKGVAGGATTLPDPLTHGALRFTNGCATNCTAGVSSTSGGYEDGAIIWAGTPFQMGNGLQITFKTVSYRGNADGPSKTGGDGMSFYLIDGTLATTSPTYNGVGNLGGSAGYGCSNTNGPDYDGLVGAYIGLGMDEYGNFLDGASWMPGYTGPNPVNPTNLGYTVTNGDNGALGYGYHVNRIGLRGRGSVSWAYLNKTYPTYYPSNLSAAVQSAAVQNACIHGVVANYANITDPGQTPGAVSPQPTPPLYDYAPITTSTGAGAYLELPSTVQLGNETALARPDGTTTNGVTNGNVFVYSLKITQSGLLSLSYSLNGGAYNPVISGQNITAQNGAPPASFRFGFAAASGGATNIHEVLCFQAAPIAQSATSTGGDQKQTGEVQTTAQDYFAYYDPNDWTGRLTAYGLSDDGAGNLTVNTLANWDAQCVLTGVAKCINTGVYGPTSPEAPGSRVMLTYNGTETNKTTNLGTAGIPFEWANLTSNEANTLDAGDATPFNANRLNYLRGVRTNEIDAAGAGLFRARDGILGDIIDSSPVWVGPPNSPYALTWRDRLYPSTTMPENTGTKYANYLSSNQGRLNVVYVGANDGFLHGFRAGSEDSSGNVINNPTTPNDGYEVLAYMPGPVLNAIHNAGTPGLDYSNAQYAHNFYVDATPGSGDVYYGGAWHSWLVGGLGGGGAAIYALDVTTPSSFTEGYAAPIVKGEFSSSTITCVGNSTCGTSLGNTYGTPQIRRFHNGTWGAVFGNGFGSASGDAGIYVMTIDSSSGNISNIYYLSTATGSAAAPNGIAYVAAADLDGDHITDYVYAGDLQGNVWRFDLTSVSPGNWAVSAGSPLFKTPTGQPITTQLVLASSLVSGTSPQLMVAFGTGERTEFTNTSSTSYVTNTPQSLYGIWDWNLSAWNASNATAQYASLTTAQYSSATGDTTSPYTLSVTNLQVQTLSANTTTGTVTTSDNTVVWEKCSPGCNRGYFGWYAVLPGTNGVIASNGAKTVEQLVSNPSLYQSALLLNSTIPANNSPLSCTSPSTDSGVLYAVSVTTGGTFSGGGGAAPGTDSSAFTSHVNTQTVGLMTNETGSVAVANSKEGTTWLVGQNIQTTPGAAPGQTTQIKLPINTTVSRVTWVELR